MILQNDIQGEQQDMPKNEEEPWCLQILYLNSTRWTRDSHHVTSTKIERIQLFISTGKRENTARQLK
jgi:hypothetical protein